MRLHFLKKANFSRLLAAAMSASLLLAPASAPYAGASELYAIGGGGGGGGTASPSGSSGNVFFNPGGERADDKGWAGGDGGMPINSDSHGGSGGGGAGATSEAPNGAAGQPGQNNSTYSGAGGTNSDNNAFNGTAGTYTAGSFAGGNGGKAEINGAKADSVTIIQVLGGNGGSGIYMHNGTTKSGAGGNASIVTAANQHFGSAAAPLTQVEVKGGYGGAGDGTKSAVGGNGGSASLIFGAGSSLNVYTLTVASGAEDSSVNNAGGSGGTVTFDLSGGSLTAGTINLTQTEQGAGHNNPEPGNLSAFNVGTLAVNRNTTFNIANFNAVRPELVATIDNIELGDSTLTVNKGGGQESKITANTLTLTGKGRLSDADSALNIGSLTIDGGTISNNNASNNTDLLSRTYTSRNDITLGTNGATFEVNSGSITIDRKLTGTGGLIKTGGNILYLNNASNDYTGVTKVQNGILQLGNMNALGNSEVELSRIDNSHIGMLQFTTGGTFSNTVRNGSTAGWIVIHTSNINNPVTLTGNINTSIVINSGSLELKATGKTQDIPEVAFIPSGLTQKLIGTNVATITRLRVDGQNTVLEDPGNKLTIGSLELNSSGPYYAALSDVDDSAAGLINNWDGFVNHAYTNGVTVATDKAVLNVTTDRAISNSTFKFSSDSAMAINKTGAGKLTLTVDSPDFLGKFNVKSGDLELTALRAAGTNEVNLASGSTLFLSVADAPTYGFDTAISGEGAVIANAGAGNTLSLTRQSSYTGGTTVNDGVTLALQHSNAAGTGEINLDGTGSRLLLGHTGSSANDITGSGGVIIDNDVTLTRVKNGNTYTGGTTVNDGKTLTMTAADAAGTGEINLNGAGSKAAFNFAGQNQNSISGAGSVRIDAQGSEFTLAEVNNTANNYAGGTAFSNGRLRIASENAAGSGAIHLDSGGGAAALHLDHSLNLNNAIDGTGDLVVENNADARLSGQLGYSGATRLLSGRLHVGANDLSASSAILLTGGSVIASDNGLNLKNVTIDASNGQAAAFEGNLTARDTVLDFITPSAAFNGPLLQGSGNADISRSTYNLSIASGEPLTPDFQLVLIRTKGSLTAEDIRKGTGMDDIQIYDIQVGSTMLYQVTPLLTANELSLIMQGKQAMEQSKALSEGYLGGTALAMQGADLAAGKGMDAAAQALSQLNQGEPYGLAGFGSLSGGDVRYNTGSHVDMKSLSLLSGIVLGKAFDAGRLTTGVFFEYGNGSYDTYNSFNNAAVTGNGHAWYMGGGLLARLDFAPAGPGNFYLEGSGRAGSLHNSYENLDLRNAAGRQAEYDSQSVYYSLHAGTGYVWEIMEGLDLDLFAKYLWTHQSHDSLTLSTGEQAYFSSIDSKRLRLGSRLNYQLNSHVTPHIGGAWEYEFDAKARATLNGAPVSAPELKGGTGIGEIGLLLYPSPELPLTIDVSGQAYTGKREGFTGSFQFSLEF